MSIITYCSFHTMLSISIIFKFTHTPRIISTVYFVRVTTLKYLLLEYDLLRGISRLSCFLLLHYLFKERTLGRCNKISLPPTRTEVLFHDVFWMSRGGTRPRPVGPSGDSETPVLDHVSQDRVPSPSSGRRLGDAGVGPRV